MVDANTGRAHNPSVTDQVRSSTAVVNGSRCLYPRLCVKRKSEVEGLQKPGGHTSAPIAIQRNQSLHVKLAEVRLR
jgi:hypothetical protein